MSEERSFSEERRGFRFLFPAKAEVFLENSAQAVAAHVTELSLRGCFLTAKVPLGAQLLRVKIFSEGESVEAPAEVIYTRAGGSGLVFGEMEPRSREVLQRWILAVLDHRVEQ